MKQLSVVKLIILSCILTVTALYVFPLYAAEDNKKETPLYNYANNQAEYSVALPEAPRVRTIWADVDEIPYLDFPPKSGSVGELATFKRVDPETEESFYVEIIFLKTDDYFINSLNEEKIVGMLEKDFKGIFLQNKSTKYLESDNGTLKHGILTGFSVDRNNEPFFYSEHFLTGLESIQVIKIQYSIENELFAKYYSNIMDNIRYLSM